jgi:hypothetical protein
MKMSIDRYQELLDQSIGLCRTCETEIECCEPDARKRKCPECGDLEGYGLEELLMSGDLELDEGDE